MEIVDFSLVQKKIAKGSNRNWHFLMGNGFSMAYDHEIFSYNALQSFVRDKNDPILTTVFDVLKTSNFELIMKQLKTTRLLAEAFGANEEFKNKLNVSDEKLKVNLIKAIQELHPEHVFEVAAEKSLCCSDFLQMFLNTGGELFTTNYDLLMYWILMRNDIEDISDGFGREIEFGDLYDPDDYQISDLIWGPNKDNQNINYLHGALPFFDNGIEIVKETYDGDHYLMEKVKKRVTSGDYPIFVTSGDGNIKLNQIKHNPYLTYCYDRLCKISGSLVTFGFNFGEYDDHIISAINRAAAQSKSSKLWSVYIGAYSDKDIEHIESIEYKFKNIKVKVYKSESAEVWKHKTDSQLANFIKLDEPK